MFSLEQLLFSVAQDIRTNVEILEVVLPMLKEVYDREMKARAEIQVSIFWPKAPSNPSIRLHLIMYIAFPIDRRAESIERKRLW